MREHWARFGRNYFSRYDYEEVDSKEGDEVMTHIEKQIKDKSLIGKKLAGGEGANRREYTVASADNFEYTDPIDKSLSTNQVITPPFASSNAHNLLSPSPPFLPLPSSFFFLLVGFANYILGRLKNHLPSIRNRQQRCDNTHLLRHVRRQRREP